MNFLAHLCLSGDDSEIRIGNYIADSVKGKKYNNYSRGVRFGILLHRKIDTFTDNHIIVKKIVEKFRPAYGKFSGAVIDMLFDHFLAKNWNKYSSKTLTDYSKEVYQSIEENFDILPEKIQYFSKFFIKRDRLNCYADLDCFEDVLLKMGIHTSLPEKSKEGMKIIKENYDEFQSDFDTFFSDILAYVQVLMKLRNEEPEVVLGY